MTFYSIRSSGNKKIIGHYPQIEKVTYNCHVWDDPKFIDRIQFEKADFDPIVSIPSLFKSSKTTDLIHTVGIGFVGKLLVSGKLKNLFENHRKTGLQFFKCPVIHRDKQFDDYWCLNIFEFDMDFIDFRKSQFLGKMNKAKGGNYVQNLSFKSYEIFKENLEKKRELGFSQLFISKVKLNHSISEDFFALQHVEGTVKYIVSEKLKKLIEETCTGIEFMPLEMTLSQWLQGGERKKVYG